MRKLFFLAATAYLSASCSSLTGYPTDEAASYARAIEVTQKNVDSDKFKIYSLRFSETGELSNNLGYVIVKMVNRDNQAFSQTFLLNGQQPSSLRDVERTFEAPEYETTVGIDPGKLDPQVIADRIAQAKTMLPEGHTFKSVGEYDIEETVPADNEFINRKRKIGEQKTSFVVRFTEDGKETESNAGQTSIIYYEARATVAPDGTITIEEN